MLFRKKQRAPADTEVAGWNVRESRFQDSREGQPLDIAGRVAICPRGHKRAIPTRFDRPVAELRCPECRRAYPFPPAAPQEAGTMAESPAGRRTTSPEEKNARDSGEPRAFPGKSEARC